MRALYTFISITLLSISLSCHDEKKEAPQDCCGNPAIEASFGNGHVYVPNIFTPNGDGINDILLVFGDSVNLISSFQISNEDGDLVFYTQNFNPNDQLFGWNGEVNGEVIEGVYDILLLAMAKDGTVKELEGKVCNYPCSVQPLPEISTPDQCQFPAQSWNGHFGPTLPSGENFDCF